MASETTLMGLLKTPSQIRKESQEKLMQESLARSQQMITGGGTTALPGILSRYGAQAAQRGAMAGAGLLRGITGGLGTAVGGDMGQRIADLGVPVEERQARAQQQAMQGLQMGNLQSMKATLKRLQESGAPAQALMGLQQAITKREQEVKTQTQQTRNKYAAIDYIRKVDPELADSLSNASPEQISKATEAVAKRLEPKKVGNSLVALNTTTGDYESVYSEPKEKDVAYEIITPNEAKTLGLPPGPVYQRNKNTQQITTVVGQKPSPALSAPPTGYRYNITDNADGSQTIEAVVIDGTPQSQELEAQQKAVKAGRRNKVDKLMSVVNPAIDEAIRIAEDPENWATGKPGSFIDLLGKVTGGVAVAGTSRLALNEQLTTVKANIGFDKLQKMRDESPTGGALGQVAIQELYALQNSLAPLNPDQNSEDLVRSLETVRDQYRKAVTAIANDLTDEQLRQEGLEHLIGFRTHNRLPDGTYVPLEEPQDKETDSTSFDMSVLPADIREGWGLLGDAEKQALREAYSQ